MRVRLRLASAVAVVALGACGSEDPAEPPAKPQTAKGAKKPATRGTTITAGQSEFGRMLYDSRRQAIYIFESDSPNKTVCYGKCAKAWPPVLTRARPRAANGVKRSLLGTLKRRDGKLQVTYAGKPLYFYAHEKPDEVRCHNVDLKGGFWWVIGPDGERRPA
jgi:predicted lipoprotein with Yx(FWY)xxD motif